MSRVTRFVLCAAAVAGCQPIDRNRGAASTPDSSTAMTAAPVSAPTKVAAIEGFLTPESVLHDTTQDIYFVSNINGSPTAKDNNGFISRVRPDGAVENLKFI